MLGARPLNASERSANLLDQLALAAEIDRMLPTVLSISEPIVGAEGFFAAVPPTGDDAALQGEQFGPEGQQAQCRMFELVNRGRNFQFHDDSRL